MTERVCRVVLTDISALDISIAEARLSGTEIASHAANVTDPVLKKQRLATGLILKGVFGINDARHTALGAPTVDGGVSVSVSHRGEWVLVAALDDADTVGIGVDLEAELKYDTAERVEKRFLRDFNPRRGRIDEYKIVYSLAALTRCADVAECFELDLKRGTEISSLCGESVRACRISPDSSVTAKWCALEATLKTGAKGFADLNAVGELSQNTGIDCLKIEHGCLSMSIAVAIKE